MFKIATFVFYFVRELVFDSRKEYDFRSAEFDPRKIIFFVMLSASLGLNWVLGVRSVELAHEAMANSEKIRELEVQIVDLKDDLKVDKSTIVALQAQLYPPLTKMTSGYPGKK